MRYGDRGRKGICEAVITAVMSWFEERRPIPDNPGTGRYRAVERAITSEPEPSGPVEIDLTDEDLLRALMA